MSVILFESFVGGLLGGLVVGLFLVAWALR